MSIKFAIISDVQYCDQEDFKNRTFRDSLNRLQAAVDFLNSETLDFVVQLGDFIDNDFHSYEQVLKVWKGLKHKSFHVLGNHDFCVDSSDKEKVAERLGLKSNYYSFEFAGYKFISLDGNDLSLNRFPEKSNGYNDSKTYWESLNNGSEWWNGAIGKDQLKWLEDQLNNAERKVQPVVIFCHFPLLDPERYTLWNSAEVIGLLNKFSCVKLWVNGHYHQGGFQVKNGINFLTVKGMVEHEKATFSIVELQADSLTVNGFGDEDSRLIKI